GSERFVNFDRLVAALVRLLFDLLHCVLQTSPLASIHRYELQTELLEPFPPDYGLLDQNGSLLRIRYNSNFQGGSWLNVNDAFNTTTANGEINDISLSADHADGRE
ncbi:MAG TPA: hypothetical protein VN638_03845, partial [Nitrospiraceae bacterium]|nr:hypothetical protein [Nitrospiraceae bacterium]